LILRAFPAHGIALAAVIFLLSTAEVWSVSAQTRAIDLSDARQALTQYKIDLWQTEQGLPLNTVQALLQTRDGYLWVGTSGGLARFDGDRFITMQSAQIPALGTRAIFGFMEDSADRLWIGYSEGAAIHHNGRFEVAFGREVTNGRRVWGFAQDREGGVWAASENGLVYWKNGVKKLYRQADGLPTDRLRSVAFDSKGILWIGTTGGGLVSFDGSRFKALQEPLHKAVRYVLPDPRSGVWVATAGGGLAHVDGQIVKRYGVADGLPTDQLTALSFDAMGSLWIGTWGAGLCRLRDGRFSSISNASGLAGGQIWSVHADREGNIWVGTWVAGLNRLKSRDFVVLGTPEGLSHDNVRSVLHAHDGSAWIAVSGGGVNRITGSKITAYRKSDGLPTDETSSICEDRDGSIWIGTYTAGIARLKDGRIETYGADRGLTSLDVRALFQDRSGTLWAGTVAGLFRFDGRRFNAVRDKGSTTEVVTAILEDHTGTIWFATADGLNRYRNGLYDTLTREDGLASNWIMSLYEDRSGSLWIGTNGDGLNRIRNGKISTIRPGDGLWDGMAQVILEDRNGNFWITCNRGFYRVSRAELDEFAAGTRSRVTSFGYGPGDALRSTSFAGGLQPAGAVDAAGRLWLPSFSGLLVVDPANLPRSGEPPSVRIDRVTVNGVEVPSRSAIILPPGSAPLAIRYMATTLRNADRVRFRYRMSGASNEWVDAGQSREAFFPLLRHGTYRFQVAASIDGTTWGPAATPLSITVRPRFFQAPWFLSLVALVMSLSVLAVIKLRTRHLRQQKEEMQRLVTERTEELRQANEHLAQLSFVDSLTGLANRRRFDETFEQEWQRAKRFQTPLALLIADVDYFKLYNDTLGHPEGDKCLAALAEILRHEARRAGDLVARYGGEEFVIVVPGADLDAAVEFAERIRKACEEGAIPHPASSTAPVVTISVGLGSRVPADESTSETLLQEADAALYQAKRNGRNRVGYVAPFRGVVSG